MAKSEPINVIIQEVRPIEILKDGLQRQTIILLEPGYTDSFGEKKGRDNRWWVDAYGDRIAKLNIRVSDVNRKAKVRLSFSSTESIVNGGIRRYEVSAKLNEITFLQ